MDVPDCNHIETVSIQGELGSGVTDDHATNNIKTIEREFNRLLPCSSLPEDMKNAEFVTILAKMVTQICCTIIKVQISLLVVQDT